MTGDTGVLEEIIPFLSSRPLRDDEEANYDLPEVSDDIGTVYQHVPVATATSITEDNASGFDRTVFNETFRKPFDAALLAERVRTLVNRRKQLA